MNLPDWTETMIGVKIVEWEPVIPIKVDLTDDSGQVLLTDSITGALVAVDIVHHRIHSGIYYSSSYAVTGVINGGNVDVRLVVGAREIHFAAKVSAGGQSTVTLYEGANLSGGTGMTVFNHYRGAGDLNPPYATYHTPVVTTTGSALIQELIAGGNSPQTRVGAGNRPGEEMILLPNTTYLLRINNSSGAAIAIGVIISGYASH